MSDPTDLDPRRALRHALGFPLTDSQVPADRKRRHDRSPARRTAAAAPEKDKAPAPSPAPVAGAKREVANREVAPPAPSPSGVLEDLAARLEEALDRIARLEGLLTETSEKLNGRVLEDLANAAASRTSKAVVAALRQEMVAFSDRLSEVLTGQQSVQARAEGRPRRG